MEEEPSIDPKAKIYLSILNNKIVEDEYKSYHILPIVI